MNTPMITTIALVLRVVISLIIYFSPINLYVKVFILFFLTDLIDEYYLRFATKNLNKPSDFIGRNLKSGIAKTYEYHLTDKAGDLFGYVLGVSLLAKTNYNTNYLMMAIMIRFIGVSLFFSWHSSDVWIIFPDIIKEFFIANIFFQESPVLFLIVYILKAIYEYYHHQVNGNRDFDQ